MGYDLRLSGDGVLGLDDGYESIKCIPSSGRVIGKEREGMRRAHVEDSGPEYERASCMELCDEVSRGSEQNGQTFPQRRPFLSPRPATGPIIGTDVVLATSCKSLINSRLFAVVLETVPTALCASSR